MATGPQEELDLTFHPLTLARWADFESLFGARGACGGCWCMWPRLTRKAFLEGKGAGNKKAVRALVRSGEVPGILAYAGDVPVGWCALGPRPVYTRLAASRVLAPVDEKPTWSVVCFFVARGFRRKGVSVRLLEAASAYAASLGATLLEGYPEEHDAAQPDAFVYRGLASAFRKAGFKEALRRSPKRPIMRKVLTGKAKGTRQ